MRSSDKAAAPDLLAEARRDLDFIVDVIALMETLSLTGTVQFTRAKMREEALRSVIAQATAKQERSS